MSEHVIIDGNNLLHAAYAHAPVPTIGRETLVRVIDAWAGAGGSEVTLVFDGPVPPRGLARQMSPRHITVRFSAPVTADDIIVEMVESASRPDRIRVVTSDKAVAHAARYRRCAHTDAVGFVGELFSARSAPRAGVQSEAEKPSAPTSSETEDWLRTFEVDEEDTPFDGHGAMEA